MRLVGKHEAGMVGVEVRVGDGIKHPITQTPLHDADDSPNADFGTVLSAQAGGKRVLVKQRRAFVWIGHLPRLYGSEMDRAIGDVGHVAGGLGR